MNKLATQGSPQRLQSRKKEVVDFNMYGHVPPQAKELEQAVLGAIMLEKSAIDSVASFIRPECFYSEAHQIIYGCFESMASKSIPIDLLTTTQELKQRGELEQAGGPYYIVSLTNAVTSTASLESHGRIILQKFLARELIRISGENIAEAYDESTDVFDMLDGAEAKMFNITGKYLKRDYDRIDNSVAKTVQRIDELRNKQDDISGVPSGFHSLDRLTYGWQPTDLIILAARPSMGKTAFALNLGYNAAMNHIKPVPVGIFSLEMSNSQLTARILSAASEIPLDKINRGRLDGAEYGALQINGVRKLEQAPIYIDDTPALNILEFRSKARRMVNKNGVGLILIDYLQLMSGIGDNRNSNREQEISNISRNLKALAKELHIPIIALSQLSRQVESRKESKMPMLSDLRESGAIEQDADVVMFMYRPEYYENFSNEMGESTQGETLIRIAKHRNGITECIKLRANLSIQKFEDWDTAPSPFSPLKGGNFYARGGENPF